MALQLVFGVVGALCASVLYSLGAALQALEARRVPDDHPLGISLLRRLIARPVWIGGTLCVFVGWGLQAGSLLLAPVTVVQPTLAVGLVLLLLIGVRVLGEEVGQREVLAVAAIVAGVVGLALAGPGQSTDHAGPVVLAPVLTGIGVLALVPYALRRSGVQLATVVVSAGLAYAFCGLSTSFAGDAAASGRWGILALWLGLTGVGAVVALISEMTAFQRAPVTHVFPVILVVQIAVAVGLAPLVLGESWKGTPVVGLAASIAVVTAGAAALIGTPGVGAALAKKSSDAEGG